MFDFGWSELFLIMVIAVLVLGPKEIPVVMRTLGGFMRRLKYMHYAIMQQIDQMIDIHDEKSGEVPPETQNEMDSDDSVSADLESTDLEKEGVDGNR